MMGSTPSPSQWPQHQQRGPYCGVSLLLPRSTSEALEALLSEDVVSVVSCEPRDSGASCAVVTLGQRNVFIKWDSQNDAWTRGAIAREASRLRLVGAHVQSAHFLAYSPEHHLLVTEALDGPEPQWNDAGALDADGHVLNQLAALPFEVTSKLSSGRYDFDRDRRGDAALSTAVEPRFQSRLYECYEQQRKLVRDTPCHWDAWSDNWLSHDGTPHLVDFEHLALGPAGWDHCFLITWPDVPTEAKVRWLSTVATFESLRAMIGAITFWTAINASVAREPGNLEQHCRAALPCSLDLCASLGIF